MRTKTASKKKLTCSVLSSFPAIEAIEAGVVRQVPDDKLAHALLDLSEYAPVDTFMSVMGGSVEKTLDVISDFMER